LLSEILLHFYDFETWFNGIWSVAKSKVRGFRSPQSASKTIVRPAKFRTLIFSRNPHFIASNLAGNETYILFISISSCRVFLPQIRKPRSVAMFAGSLTSRLATGRVNPQHAHQENIFNDTSQRPNIIPETQHSMNHRNLQFQPCYFHVLFT
jgi:hypothetical protein